MSVQTLPTEVVELILINAAAAGHPETIAAFSQTCRAHHDLVYGPSDQHLWREIFLSTFDDPRVTGGGPGWYDANARKPSASKDISYNWGEEYRLRIWAARYIRRRTDPDATRIADSLAADLDKFIAEYETSERDTRALDALVSVINTAAPCPATIVFSFIPPDESPSDNATTTTAGYPTFPPLPQAIGGSSGGIVPVGPFDGSGRGFGQALSARNMAWLQSVLVRGYPPVITARFSGQKWEGGIAGQYLEPDDFHQLQSAGRLIAHTGFIPVPHPEPPVVPPVGDTVLDRLSPADMSEEKQRRRARRLARMRVYNMRYLARERHWGPYLPHTEKRARPSRIPVDDDELLQPILALFRFAPQHADEDGPEDEQHDEDAITDGDEDEDEDGGDGAEDEDEDEEDGGDTDANTQPIPTPAGPPTPAQLRADWAYLAAVRTVIEANLRETFSEENLSGLLSLDGLRPGSAPWDADQYKTSTTTGDSADSSTAKGKEEALTPPSDSEEVEGWDWAGVTGIWKRCVCWMDYRDLILHNLSGEFDDPHLAEAVRIIAMRLRIKSYSRSDVPGYEHLPTIHVVGETTGASISGQPRRIHGTVGMIADGSVRWNLQYSTAEGADEDEWVSEGVQVGGVASAMGVLGMWTGAHHERMDPLGPCWAWKVG
ncbi:hypothetical protein FKP32DRAFT_1567364 [Trametes sanguinea]|nr:hypothetical protein FKP32DRAFT_1567364 [Trametes sanguinea]